MISSRASASPESLTRRKSALSLGSRLGPGGVSQLPSGCFAGRPALRGQLLDALVHVRDRLLHALELPALDLDQAHAACGLDARGAAFALQQAHLAEDVAGPELPDLFAAPGDL